MINVIRKIALTDGVQTVILSNILEGVDGASTFGLTAERSEIKVEDGQTRALSEAFTLDIRVVKAISGDEITLKNWANTQTPVLISGLGIDGALLFSKPVTLVYKDDFGGRLIADQFKASIEQPLGYVCGQKKVYAGSNLLGNSYVLGSGGCGYPFSELFGNSELLDDIGASGSADSVSLLCPCNAGEEGAIYYTDSAVATYDGWTLGAGMGAGVSGQNLHLTFKNATDATLYSPYIFFPFPGEKLTGSIRLVATNNSATYGDVAIAIQFLNQSKSIINDTNLYVGALNGLTPPERLDFQNVTIPAGTFYMRFYLEAFDDDFVNGDTFVLTAPFLTNKQSKAFEL